MAEQRNKQRRTGASKLETAAAPPPATLQRKAGNRAVSGMIEQLRATPDGTDAGTSGPVAWEHPTFERQADDIAAKAKGITGTNDRRSGMSGAPLAGSDAAKLTALTGKDVSKVRLHTGEDSAGKAAAMGAHAFTSGTDIHFGPGEYDPASPKGFELLAHEVTHAVQHPTGHDHAGGELVHAKLKGMRKAMEDLGGKKSKSLRKKALGSNWNDLLSKLGDYEKLEASYSAAVGTGAPERKVAALREKLLTSLTKLERVALKWRQANDEEGAERVKSEALADLDNEVDEDTRTKASRRQAVTLFLTRTAVDKRELERGGDPTSGGLDDSTLSWGKDDAVGGGMNRLDQVAYATEDGEILEGYFKADKAFTAKMAGHDKEVGIAQHDANYAGRSVAMYRLDQLLQGGVIARTEFAVHTSRDRLSETATPGESNLGEATTKFGFVTEKAKGESMGDVLDRGGFTRSAEQRDDPSAVAANDPVLQSCLNKLQILDAIAGQLDRHVGNYFIERDPLTGEVLGVTGIDNDMSFGANMQTPDQSGGAFNYLAMPELVDEEFGRRLLQVSDDDIRDTLAGLLTDREIEATVSRFRIVRDVVANLEEKGELTAEWGDDSLQQQLSTEANFTPGGRFERERSMIARETFAALKDAEKPAKSLLTAAGMKWKDSDRVFAEIRKLVLAGELEIAEIPELTERVVADLEKYVDKRGEDKLPELGEEWITLYVEGAHRRL